MVEKADVETTALMWNGCLGLTYCSRSVVKSDIPSIGGIYINGMCITQRADPLHLLVDLLYNIHLVELGRH